MDCTWHNAGGELTLTDVRRFWRALCSGALLVFAALGISHSATVVHNGPTAAVAGGLDRVGVGLQGSRTASSDAQQRVIVVLKDQAPNHAAPAGASVAERRRAVFDERSGFAEASQGGLRVALGSALRSGRATSVKYLWIVNAAIVTADATTAQAIAARSDVAAVLEDEVFTVEGGPAAPAPDGGNPEWNIQRVGAPATWALGVRGAGVVVGSIDTGVIWTHPALKRQYRGWNGTSATHDYNWADFVGNGAEPYDDVGHGTHTIGTTVGDDDTGNQIGVAPDAMWIAAKACSDEEGCSSSTLLEAMEWMQAPTNAAGLYPDPSKAPDIVINAWNFPGNCSGNMLLRDVLVSWRAAGILPVSSGGNNYVTPRPACYPESFAVGVTDANDILQSWSGHGPSPSPWNEIKPDLSAPGVDIRSADTNGGYALRTGTSMSAPHVAGVAALIESYAPGLSLDDLEGLLTVTASDRGDAGPDNAYGAGIVDALAALQRLRTDIVKPTVGQFQVRDRVTGVLSATNETLVTVSVAATDDTGVVGYLLTNNSSLPSPADARWSPVRPTTHTLAAGAGMKTVYAWARDAKGNLSSPATVSITLDTAAPSTTVVVAPLTRNTTVGVKVTATDNTTVAGYVVSASPQAPTETDSRWLGQAPTSVALPKGDGSKRVYAWTKDPAGNISSATPGTTALDTVGPSVEFSAPATTSAPTVPINLSSTDANGVAGYFISDGQTAPPPASSAWAPEPPTGYALKEREGRRTLFAWAIDNAGNISRRVAASIFKDTRAPRVAISAPSGGSAIGALWRIRGIMSDPYPSSGIVTAMAALARVDGGGCSWWKAEAGALVKGLCDAPLWFKVTMAGRYWSAMVRVATPGTYRLLVLGVDRAGNKQSSHDGGSASLMFSIRAGGATDRQSP